jgi:uncharacterized protein YdhG (YjbR/CyaY superfamily)
MEHHSDGFRSIDEYIAAFPEEMQRILESVRATIRAVAPNAVERMSYQMPAFALNGNLVYFAAWKNHIGLYPASSTVPEAFKDELSGYKGTKGTIRFPIDQPLPLELISEIVRYRVTENLSIAAAKELKRKG